MEINQTLAVAGNILFMPYLPCLSFPSQGPNIALIINCSISLSTGCLLVLIIAFHYKDIKVSSPSPLCFLQLRCCYCGVSSEWVHAILCASLFLPVVFVLNQCCQINILFESPEGDRFWRSSRSTDGSLNTDYLCYICCVRKKTWTKTPAHTSLHDSSAAAIFFQSTWLAAVVCEFSIHGGIWLKLNTVNIFSLALTRAHIVHIQYTTNNSISFYCHWATWVHLSLIIPIYKILYK